MADSKFQAWFKASRPRTLPLALSSIGMGGFLAAHANRFNLGIFLLCISTTLLLQILSNFANDYGDTENGADSSNRTGPQRAVQAGIIKPGEMKMAMLLFSALSFISGIALLIMALTTINTTFIIFLVLGLASIAAAIKYTAGSNPYGYSGFGDLFVFLFFGITAVTGTYYLQTESLRLDIFLPAISSGMFSVAVLNVNNIRDIESDEKAGKYSIPVRLGEKKAKIYHLLLLTIGNLAAILYTIINFDEAFQFIFLLTLPLFIKNYIGVQKHSGAALDPYLKQMALSTLAFVLLFGLGLLFS